MEKILDLRKERNISNCLSYDNKIKLNINLINKKFFDKAVKEISKKVLFKKIMEKENIEDKKNYLENLTTYFSIKIELLDDNNSDEKLFNIIGTVYNHYAKNVKEDIKQLLPVKCTVTDKENNYFQFYSILLDRINNKSIKYLYYYKDTSIKVIDIFTILSEIFIINEIKNYYDKNFEVCTEILNKIINNHSNKIYRYTQNYIKHLQKVTSTNSEFFLNLTNMFVFNKKTTTAILSNLAKETLAILFKEMVFDNEDIVLQEKQLKQMNSDYARAFEQKKNINKEILKAMKISNFNNYFKGVEFDNDVDLNKIVQIEKEFKDVLGFLNPILQITKYMKDITLRFRYLGKHKAAGLYFPYYKTMCIDLRCPNSFLHEFLHMVDYQGYISKKYKLSSQYDFRQIAKKYIQILDDTVTTLSTDEPFKKQYLGKTKYNRDYYCNTAEIFARCGEIYFNRILKINNNLIKNLSILKPSYEYPENKELEDMICQYYKQFFKITEKKSSIVADVKQQQNFTIDDISGQCKFILL